MFKEKSGAALEAAKSSNAGKTIAGGLSTAANASQEQYGKLKESDAFKKSSTLASGAYERTSVVASGALEKVLPTVLLDYDCCNADVRFCVFFSFADAGARGVSDWTGDGEAHCRCQH